MRTIATILLGAALFLPLSAFGTEIPGGPVYGHWYSSGNPYNINGNINIPVGSTLYIHEGVEVIFQGYYALTVNGYLEAVGTEVDSIHFMRSSGSWFGITFQNAPDSSHLIYCSIIDVGWAGILCQNSNPVLSHCSMQSQSAMYGIRVLDPSNPSISHCDVSYNYMGIVWSSLASGIISDCVISHNWGLGGIRLISDVELTIIDCIISDNVSNGRGGGVRSDLGTLTLINCTINDNTAQSGRGGGISCSNGSATLTNCTINGNYAIDNTPSRQGGGGISLYNAHAALSYCSIYDNFAMDHGGGIAITNGNLTVDHCTIDENETWGVGLGSGIYILSSNTAVITNSIISNNHDGYGIYNQGTLTVGYTDFFNNDPGPISGNIPTGFGELTQTNANGDSCDVYYNIFLDPVFVGRYSEDYNLRWRSPCIDAGDPNSPLDPDNTVCDMGQFYFNQDVMGVVELYPHADTIVIPPEGGQLVYDGWVFNFIGHPGRADIWTYAFVPGMGRYGPIDLYSNFRIPPDSIGMNNIRQNVPGLAPAGDYVFAAYVGSYPGTIIDSSYFYFCKEGSVAGEIGDWSSSGLLFKRGDETAFNLPSHYVLSQNYPNPFNATTVIEYTLPVESHVKLEVYNLLGEKVATLVDSKQQAGYRSVNWDASGVSSGLYFYRLTAGDYTETRRMMLVK